MEKQDEKRSFVDFTFVKNVDLFKRALPQFNLKGKSDVGTVAGDILSIVILYTTFLFASTNCFTCGSKKSKSENVPNHRCLCK